MKRFLATIGLCSALFGAMAQTSPNGKIEVKYEDNAFMVYYDYYNGWTPIMRLPITLHNAKPVKTESGKVKYSMRTGKRLECKNAYTQCTYKMDDGQKLIIKAWNDGVTWTSNNTASEGLQTIQPHLVDFSMANNNWLMKWSDSYEGFFPQNRELTSNEHLGYPALFEYKDDLFALLSESNMDSVSCASSFYTTPQKGVYEIKADGPGVHGDQTLIIGTLADLVQSTLVTDNSKENRLKDDSWVQPGVASWVYWAYNHGSKDYNIIKRYTDMAAELHLPYVLIDAEWDEAAPMVENGETMPMVEAAVRYANSLGVKPMIWYNSSIGWVNGAPGPKFRLNKPENLEREFAWCERIGVKGVKIDFFSGDNNKNIRFMVQLLECAAKHHLVVNFHGATVPRGLQRTYPNLVSTEGVYGAEWYNNVPTFTTKAPQHNATLPFTRNVIGSMDYTPCAWTDSQHPHITTHAHELALTVLYESGIQHLADRPESFLNQPDEVKNMLSELPTAWDETKFLDGYPGESAVIGRRKGTRWYIASINGTDVPRVFDLQWFVNEVAPKCKRILLFADGKDPVTEPWSITEYTKMKGLPKLQCYPHGGFTMVIEN